MKDTFAEVWGLVRTGRLNTLLVALTLLVITTIVGMVGYMYFQKLAPADALYLSVIVLSTVGMNEVGPLTPSGRVFTMVYILLNFTIFGYFVSVITRYVFEGELRRIFKNYWIKRRMERLHDHIIICGFGRYGRKVAEHLAHNRIQNFLIVDRDPAKVVDHFADRSLPHWLEGDATDDEVLKRAGVEKAQVVITTLPDDAGNVYVALIARELNPHVKIVARASSEAALPKLRRAGANHVVMPDVIGGMHMANLVIRPEVVEFNELLSGVGEGGLRLEELRYHELRDEFKNQTIKQLLTATDTGVHVIGFKDAQQGFIFSPEPQRRLGEGDTLIIIGRDTEVRAFIGQLAR
jgi:voltage-gated potassium channel